jgi:fatty acid desaturase
LSSRPSALLLSSNRATRHRRRDFRAALPKALVAARWRDFLAFFLVCRRIGIFGASAFLALLAFAATAPSADPMDSATVTKVVSALGFLVGISFSELILWCCNPNLVPKVGVGRGLVFVAMHSEDCFSGVMTTSPLICSSVGLPILENATDDTS